MNLFRAGEHCSYPSLSSGNPFPQPIRKGGTPRSLPRRCPAQKSRAQIVPFLLYLFLYSFVSPPFHLPGRAGKVGLTPLYAGEDSLQWNRSGLLYLRYDQDLKKDMAGEDTSELHTKLYGSLEAKKPGEYRIFGSFLLRHEFLWNGEELRSQANPELWEASYRLEKETFTLEAGNLVRRFGRGLPSVWDILNPPDLREGFALEDEFQKVPVPMLRATLYREEGEYELLYLPFYRPPRTPSPQSDWGVLRITDFEGLESAPLVQAALAQGIYPGTVHYPPDDFLHGELALRASFSYPFADLDFYGFTGYDRFPLPAFHPDFLLYLRNQTRPLPELLRNLSLQELLLFQPLYEIRPRRALFLGGAASFQTLLGSLRAELQGVSQEPIYEKKLELLRPPALHLLAGLDSLAREEFLYSFSLVGITLFTRKELFLIHPFTLLGSGVVRGTFLPRWQWELRGLLNLSQGDAWVSPSLLYSLIPDLTLQLGLQLFLSEETLPLGFFTHNNLIYLRMKFLF